MVNLMFYHMSQECSLYTLHKRRLAKLNLLNRIPTPLGGSALAHILIMRSPASEKARFPEKCLANVRHSAQWNKYAQTSLLNVLLDY